MNGFERRKEQKKENIRRAAMELFRTYGFDKVSMGDIARQASVSHVTIYNHFGSKEDLVRDVIQTAISDLVTSSREVIEGDEPFLEKLKLIIFSKVRLAGQYQGGLMRAATRDYPEMREFIETLWQKEIDPLINRLIDEGQKLGYIKKDLSRQAVRYYFEIVRNGAFATPDALAELKVDDKLARDLNNLFLFGLVSEKE
jgi:AcrR family transcriptional regulator